MGYAAVACRAMILTQLLVIGLPIFVSSKSKGKFYMLQNTQPFWCHERSLAVLVLPGVPLLLLDPAMQHFVFLAAVGRGRRRNGGSAILGAIQ